jgi:type IV pilus assembly protein PilQ
MAEGVERFGECGCLAEPDANGPWVRYSDYEMEKARADGHSRAYDEAVSERDHLDNRIGQLMRKRSEVEAERDQARNQERQRLERELAEAQLDVLERARRPVNEAELADRRKHDEEVRQSERQRIQEALKKAQTRLEAMQVPGPRRSEPRTRGWLLGEVHEVAKELRDLAALPAPVQEQPERCGGSGDTLLDFADELAGQADFHMQESERLRPDPRRAASSGWQQGVAYAKRQFATQLRGLASTQPQDKRLIEKAVEHCNEQATAAKLRKDPDEFAWRRLASDLHVLYSRSLLQQGGEQ